MQAQERLYLTKDKKALVSADDKRRAFLYAVPGDEIPTSAAEKFKLVDGRLKGSAKEKPAPNNKERKPDGDKERKPDDDKVNPASDDLTKVKGIGEASAKVLVAGGIDSYAKLAAVDPANPPAIDGLAGRVTWDIWVAEAKNLLGAADQTAA